MQKRRKLADLKQDVSSGLGWLAILSRFTNRFDDAAAQCGKLVKCPFPSHHSKNPTKKRFRFFPNADTSGMAICTCFPKGVDALELLALDGNRSLTDVIKDVQAVLDGSSSTPIRSIQTSTPIDSKPVLSPEELAKNKLRIDRILEGLVKLDHPDAKPAWRYFENRGIPLIGNPRLMFHPRLACWEETGPGEWSKKGEYPAIVSAMMTTKGSIGRLHRIFITKDGYKAFEGCKTVTAAQSNDPCIGIPVHVPPNSFGEWHVAEGIETAHAVRSLLRSDISIWSGANAPIMRNLKPPSWVKRAFIWEDLDHVNPKTLERAGEWASEGLVENCLKAGVEVRIMRIGLTLDPNSPKGIDWEDIYVTNKDMIQNYDTNQRYAFALGMSNSRLYA